MKKIAVVSCYFQPNYGSMLQAYATQEILNQLHVPNETINIEGLKPEIHTAKMRYFKSRMFSPDVIKDKWGYIKLFAEKKLNQTLRENIAVRNQKFQEFSDQMFSISKIYHSKAELYQHTEEYSAFLVGSDQLWLPSNIEADYYTLRFVPEHIRKIAYATSFGVSSLPEKQALSAKQFLPRFDFLSVREQSGQKLVKELTGLEASLVCDPTLLLNREQWKMLIKPEKKINKNYIFCYFLGNNQFARQCAKLLSKKTGFPIVALPHLDNFIREDEHFADTALYDVNPADFVNLIRHAKFVCTDSFHGTVFSLLNHKQFFTFRRFVKNTTMSTNSRIDSLLNIVDLERRIIETPDELKQQVKLPIDYGQIDETLQEFRQQSLAFLETALEGLYDNN